MKDFRRVLIAIFTLALALNFRYIFNFDQISQLIFFRESLTYSVFSFDLVGLIVIFLAILELRKTTPSLKSLCLISFLIFFLLMMISSFLSTYKPVAFHWTLRMAFSVCLVSAFGHLIKAKKYKNWFYFCLTWIGVLESVIALIQFRIQRSLGLSFLGESILSPTIPGVAKFEFMGQKIIRGYGTFPHSNVFGAFLLLCLGAIISLIIQKKYREVFYIRLFLLISFLIVNFGILISYSRSVIFVTALFYLIFAVYHFSQIKDFYQNVFCKKFKINYFFQGLLVTISFFVLLFIVYNIVAPRLCIVNCNSGDTVNPRFTLNRLAINQIAQSPFFGVGPGNFVLTLKDKQLPCFEQWEIQPAHNLFLQIAVEIGLLGLIAFMTSIICYLKLDQLSFKKIPANHWLIIVGLFLLIGLVDHYFWTIPQGLMIFSLGLVLARPS